MSEAACKTILCSGGAQAAVQDYLIFTRGDSIELQRAANAVIWELQQVVEVVHLLAEQNFSISREAAYPLIHTMDVIETQLADLQRAEAIDLLKESAGLLHSGIRNMHIAVTGEDVDY